MSQFCGGGRDFLGQQHSACVVRNNTPWTGNFLLFNFFWEAHVANLIVFFPTWCFYIICGRCGQEEAPSDAFCGGSHQR